MELKENDLIQIGLNKFTVKSVRDITFTHTEDKKTYYTYILSSGDKNITDSSIYYLDDKNITFQLTKRVFVNIEKDNIIIESKKHAILSHNVGIFMDHGEHKDVNEYALDGGSNKIISMELHSLPNNVNLLHINRKILLEEIKKIKK